MSSVQDALDAARASGVERLDAQLLLGQVLSRGRAWLLAHGDAALASDDAARFHELLARRRAGEPVAYLLGTKEFHGLMLAVDARVLVPRPDTEVLVDWAIELLRGELAAVAQPAVVDLGTGSGAIALAVKHEHPAASVIATDASPEALTVAAANASRLGLDVELLHGPWWQAMPARRFHLAVSNPPYIAAGDPHLDALVAEPATALSSGPDGLDALRVIVAGAAARLEAGGWLLLEHGFDQADAVRALLADHGFTRIESRRDLGGRPRCTGGRR